jgi:hypothetical protein
MTSYDKTTGVVYTETTSALVGSMVPTWMYQTSQKNRTKGNYVKQSALKERGQGCSSLQDMVLRHCVENIELFLPETLQWAGWHYARKIYQYLMDE